MTALPATKITNDDLTPFEQIGPLSLQRYLSQLDDAKTPEEIWENFLEYCTEMGVTYVTYGLWSDVKNSDNGFVMISNLPAEWREWTERRNDCQHLSFVRSFTLTNLTSLTLGIEFNADIRKAGALTLEHELVTQKAAELGWRSGFAMSLRSSCEGEKGGMSFGTGLTKAEFEAFLDRNGWALSIAATQTHLAYLRAEKRARCDDIELTDRQVEFLRLSSVGLETKEIAYAWGKSEQAVTKTRRTVMRKLAVNSKMAAVAKATRLNLIPVRNWQAGEPLNTTWEYGFKTQPLEAVMPAIR